MKADKASRTCLKLAASPDKSDLAAFLTLSLLIIKNPLQHMLRDIFLHWECLATAVFMFTCKLEAAQPANSAMTWPCGRQSIAYQQVQACDALEGSLRHKGDWREPD